MSISQVGNNVVATGSGTINTAGLTADTTNLVLAELNPSLGIASLGSYAFDEIFTGISGPADFGSGTLVTVSSSSGDHVSIYAAGDIDLPVGYTSGNSLSDSDTFDSTTISGLGLTPGTYTYTWGSGRNADSLTVDIQGAAPEPGTVSLLAVGVFALALNGARMRKRTLHT